MIHSPRRTRSSPTHPPSGATTLAGGCVRLREQVAICPPGYGPERSADSTVKWALLTRSCAKGGAEQNEVACRRSPGPTHAVTSYKICYVNYQRGKLWKRPHAVDSVDRIWILPSSGCRQSRSHRARMTAVFARNRRLQLSFSSLIALGSADPFGAGTGLELLTSSGLAPKDPRTDSSRPVAHLVTSRRASVRSCQPCRSGQVSRC